METYSSSDASIQLSQLMNRISAQHQPICIQGETNSVIMASEEDYRAMKETLYLTSIPGMVESILKADDENIEDCIKELSWHTTNIEEAHYLYQTTCAGVFSAGQALS